MFKGDNKVQVDSWITTVDSQGNVNNHIIENSASYELVNNFLRIVYDSLKYNGQSNIEEFYFEIHDDTRALFLKGNIMKSINNIGILGKWSYTILLFDGDSLRSILLEKEFKENKLITHRNGELIAEQDYFLNEGVFSVVSINEFMPDSILVGGVWEFNYSKIDTINYKYEIDENKLFSYSVDTYQELPRLYFKN